MQYQSIFRTVNKDDVYVIVINCLLKRLEHNDSRYRTRQKDIKYSNPPGNKIIPIQVFLQEFEFQKMFK